MVQRQILEEEEEVLQTKETSHQAPEVTGDIESNIHTLRGGGQPLPASIKSFFEPRFGHDFSRVRVHTEREAVTLAGAIQARAFTIGQNIVFGEGQYVPTSTAGCRLLAHELTHVVQQTQLSAYQLTSQFRPPIIPRSPAGKKEHLTGRHDTETTISEKSQGDLSGREKELLNETWLRYGTVGEEDFTGNRAKDIDMLARAIISLRVSLTPSASKDPLVGLDPAATRRDPSYQILIDKYAPQYYDKWDTKLQSGLSSALKQGCIRSKSSENIHEKIRQLAWLYSKYGVNDWPDWYEKNIKPATFLGMRIIWGLHTTAIDALRFAERRLKERLDRESPTWTLSFRGGTAFAGGYNVRGWQGQLGSHDFGMAFDIQSEFNIEVRGAPGIAWETFPHGKNIAFAVRFLTDFDVSEFARLNYEYKKAILEKRVSPDLSQRMQRETDKAVNASQSLAEAVAEEIEKIKNFGSNALAWEEYGARLLRAAEKLPPKLYPPMFNRARAKRDPKLLRKDWEQVMLTLHKRPSHIVKTKKGQSIITKKKESPSPAEKGFFNIPVSVVETLTDPKQPANARFRWVPFHHFELASFQQKKGLRIGVAS